jgi:SAM-dependent methyltransferase
VSGRANDPRPDLQAHYGREGLLETIARLLAAGEAANGGKGPAGSDSASMALARADEFHPGGRVATEELMSLAAPLAGSRALDLGCGIGGPARALRRRVGAGGAVVGVDAVAEYCRVARALNAREAAFADIVIEQADVLDLALSVPRFDLVWSQHAQMNVGDKVRWVDVVGRHLAPGGRYAFHETFAGPGGEPWYPTPWTRGADDSRLTFPEQWLACLDAAGFTPCHWLDRTEQSVAWLDEAVVVQRALVAAGDPAAALNVGLLLGPDAALMSRNLRRNLVEGRVRIFMGVFTRSL